MEGKIIRGIAGFYYVYVSGIGVLECKAKGIFRKNNVKPLVGDLVEVTLLDEEKKKGNIEQILKRKTEKISVFLFDSYKIMQIKPLFLTRRRL